MQWSFKRQLFFALSFLLIVLLVLGGVWYFFFYHPPTCFDGIKNQDEQGIDCDGSCNLVCEAPRISAQWARSVQVAPGVYHAVAMIRNPESGAGTQALPYTFQLFDEKNILIAERRGVTFLKPGETVPVFEPNIVTGERNPTRTFIVFGQATWTTMDRVSTPVAIVSRELDQQALILKADIENTLASPVGPVVLTSLLYDVNDILITASQTKIERMQGRVKETVVFTWQDVFSRPVVRTEIVARIQE
ncbi:hypothetical protein EPO56_01930 [Patescibacteria group bacterium]|nr:MAG: hypothetical protein EPO56_01930 [Patescibacteria group bacterium]